MQDVQNSPSSVAMVIDRVGVNNIKLPLVVNDKVNGRQHTVAMVDLGVDLPAEFKGTHMSRFVEALENRTEELSYQSLKCLLQDIKTRLHASRAFARFKFTYFMRKVAPVSGSSGLLGYECALTGELANGNPKMILDIEVPVMTVCPCSKAISSEGAHSQRAMVRMSLVMTGFAWIEEFVEIAEKSGSSPVYPVLKREDEKYVTEHSFANPCFVEDVVRSVAASLNAHPQLEWFSVEVESFESIHAHNAFARIEKHTA
ncbi:GTP cyclohydrolase FolE2 [Desulfovibrio sp. OttesenSCG-928-F07]|nr:GTP cyclohydrolase FolE2 [Desulfovibrio sp. OttesenSCG-928-F07]